MVLPGMMILLAVTLPGWFSQGQWVVGKVILAPGTAGSFDETAVKDPSIVYADGRWHVFYTARGQGQYTTGYVSSATLSALNQAPRHHLPMVRGVTNSYGCAPQVFFFRPEQRWYLVFQTRDEYYQPAYCTTTTLTNPSSWSPAQPLLTKEEDAKWIDFWVICDEHQARLFYTRNHQDVIMRTTRLEDFPSGWGEPVKVFSGVHEAVHIYRVFQQHRYHMYYEMVDQARSYGLAEADQLEGPWRVVDTALLSGAQLVYPLGRQPWTEMVSHGELIRCGTDERLEYDPNHIRFLIQGLKRSQYSNPYPEMPWQLGMLRWQAQKR